MNLNEMTLTQKKSFLLQLMAKSNSDINYKTSVNWGSDFELSSETITLKAKSVFGNDKIMIIVWSIITKHMKLFEEVWMEVKGFNIHLKKAEEVMRRVRKNMKLDYFE